MEFQAAPSPPYLPSASIDLRPSQQIKDPASLWEDPPESGKGVPAAARIDTVMKNFIQEVIQSGTFRFKTENDYIRTAVSWFSRECITPFYRSGLFDLALKRQQAMARITATARALADSERHYYEFKSAILLAVTNNQPELAKQVMRDMLLLLSEEHFSEWSTEVRRRIEAEPRLAELKGRVEREAAAREEVGH